MVSVLPKFIFEKHQTREEWMEETVSFLVELGFFQEWKRLKIQTIVQKIKDLQIEAGVKHVDQRGKNSDLCLAMWDVRRTWVLDPDALVLPGNEAYIQGLQELASISQRKFIPIKIEEEWESEDGPIIIRCATRKQTYTLKPRFLDTYIDYGILKGINEIVRESGYQFEMCENEREEPVVLFLSADEKDILKERRGWQFVRMDDL